ncbi:Cell division protein FtsI (Peptidoglycan synthetase) [Thermodesulfovibrio sp. N1]|uniref:penicillin-binding protein 2 n=1 Tax=Thermodesulfovibrio sp. N1 TaxID=1871110 RepID=UPI0008564A3A|nr:penicillin-binding protein 2 [Thermodesulfovibrio sp. N1]ODA44456.1 Cell division protein FtsI (Peptidoglycan synthetase) [Thermodesulfovibrio sp. N1]
MNNFKNKFYMGLIFFIFFIIVIRLFHLQIIKGEVYNKLSEQNRVRIIKIPAPRGIIYDRNGIPLVENIPSFSVSLSPEYTQNIDIKILSEILNIPEEEIANKIKKKPESIYIPIRIKENLTFKEVAMLEARKSEIPGLIIEIEIKRHYVYKEATAHLIGYLGKITEEHIKNNPSFRELPSYFKVGQAGLEYIYDDKLRGIPGEKVVEVDALGRELRLIKEIPPRKGEDLYLTIDAFLQESAYETLKNYDGTFIAIKPDSGEILALVSTPSFDSNLFVEGIDPKYWTALINNPKKPLLNKAIQGLYPPGSTFKVITALAGLEEGLITPEQILTTCHGGLSFGKWTFGCWRKDGHGAVNLRRALAESCDVYFYELGRILGINRISKYAKTLGLGSPTGFSSDEKNGLVPDEEWKKKVLKTNWFLGDTFNTSIGQGFLKVTPLQMALVMATIVNGGIKYKPTIIRNMQPEFEKLNLNQNNLDIIKDALIAVVNEPSGTAAQARSNLIKFGGKTGTVQVVSKKVKEKFSYKHFEHHAWFIGFAPLDTPEIAFSVIIEHGGSGGAVAAPVAKNILEGYILKKRQLNVEN